MNASDLSDLLPIRAFLAECVALGCFVQVTGNRFVAQEAALLPGGVFWFARAGAGIATEDAVLIPFNQASLDDACIILRGGDGREKVRIGRIPPEDENLRAWLADFRAYAATPDGRAQVLGARLWREEAERSHRAPPPA